MKLYQANWKILKQLPHTEDLTAAASKLYEKMENIKKCVFYMSYQKPMGNCGSKDIIPVLLIVLFGGCFKKNKKIKKIAYLCI